MNIMIPTAMPLVMTQHGAVTGGVALTLQPIVSIVVVVGPTTPRFCAQRFGTTIPLAFATPISVSVLQDLSTEQLDH